MEISTVAELESQLKQAKHNNWKDGMRDNQTVRVCPHCGRHKQYHYNMGRYMGWSPCPFCSKIRKFPEVKT